MVVGVQIIALLLLWVLCFTALGYLNNKVSCRRLYNQEVNQGLTQAPESEQLKYNNSLIELAYLEDQAYTLSNSLLNTDNEKERGKLKSKLLGLHKRTAVINGWILKSEQKYTFRDELQESDYI